MSTQQEILRLQAARNTIRTKCVALGIGTSNDKLDDLATAIDGIVNRGAVSAEIQEGATYTIPAGYHNGSGTVSGVAGGGNYSRQSKEVTPTKSQQSITPDPGYYGLQAVTVKAIPDNYQDVSSVTAAAADVLATKVFVDSTGEQIAGTMTNNGAVTRSLDATTGNQSYTIPSGYHNGSGSVSITLETKSATPTTSSQDITPTSGKVLSKVTVGAIPAVYGDTTDDDAVAANILSGKKAHSYSSADGGKAVAVTGSMTNNGAVSQTLDATTGKQSYTVPAGYHNGSGTVSITLEEKSATPSGSAQNITPTSGKVLSKVTVAAIPAKYGDTTGDDAIAANLLYGKFAHTISNGAATQIEGTMTNNAAVTATIDGLTTTSYTIPAGYHNGSGTVSLTDDIETQLGLI